MVQAPRPSAERTYPRTPFDSGVISEERFPENYPTLAYIREWEPEDEDEHPLLPPVETWPLRQHLGAAYSYRGWFVLEVSTAKREPAASQAVD